MALLPKCQFLKRPLETLLLSQTQRSIFIDYTLKCPVMKDLLVQNNTTVETKKAGGSCPFSSTTVLQTLTNTVNKAIHTAAIHANVEQKLQMETKPKEMNELNTASIQDNISIKQKVEPYTEPFKYDDHFNHMIDVKKKDHSYRVFRKINRNASHFPLAEDYTYEESKPKKVTVWCSNDYLGMSRHDHVVNAAKAVIDRNGVGAGGTRNISGTSLYHGLLEDSLAEWHEKEAGLLFTSCYVANDTALYTLGQKLPGCIIYSDSGNHASMIHGIRTSGAEKRIFRHNDPQHLEELLKNSDPNVPKIVAFETVHSMSGCVCPLEELCDISHRYGALTFVDEVHAVGLYGKYGSGIGERDGVLHKMDLISGTLGKAIGCIGGYLVGNANVIDMLRSYGAGFIFTTALPPDKAYAAYESLEILKSEEGQKLRETHQNNVKMLRTKLVQHGFPVEHAPSHIVPVLTGDPIKCTEVSQYLQQQHGIYIQSINYPTVPRGYEKLRIAPTPFHTEEMMDELVGALGEAWKKVGLSYLRPLCETDCSCQNACLLYDEQYALRM